MPEAGSLEDPCLEVLVEAPASSANLGPGFDSLAVALELRLRVRMRLRPLFEGQASERRPWPPILLGLKNRGEGADRLPQGPENRIWQAALAAFQAMDGEHVGARAAARLGVPFPEVVAWGVEIETSSAVPPSSGLGSSAAAAVSGLWGANALFGRPIGYDRLLDVAATLEGHPDNAAACALGGWVVSSRRNGRVQAVRLPVPWGEVVAVIGLPPLEFSTEQARRVLPGAVKLEDAVFNLSGAALVVASATTGRWDLLREAMSDRLHQPARLGLLPGAATAIQMALDAGAYGACLSGAGPSVLALAPPWKADRVADALQTGFAQAGIGCRTWALEIAGEGVRVRVTRPERAGETSALDAEVGE